MSVYIKGMGMPKVEFGSVIVAIRPDGMVEDVMGCYVGKAVPVPPHGRLIDADALLSLDRQIYDGEIAVGRREYIFCFEVEDAPTVIEAEEGE